MAANKVERTRIRLRKNDLVQVLSGKGSEPPKRGKILQVIPETNRVVVQGVNFIKRHTRPNPQRNIKGGIAEREAAVHASNVAIVCAECDKPTRIGIKYLTDGRKVRICRKCEGVLDK
jgi:large subunit ribosomal protein L24